MAISCKLEKDILKASLCGYSLPEVVELYFANFDDIVSTAYGTTDNTEMIDTINMKGDAKWYKVEPNRNSATFADNLQVSGNGRKYRLHTLTFTVDAQADNTLPGNIDSFSLGRYIAVARLADGNYVILGRLAGLEATESDNVDFTGGSEDGGLTITLNGNSVESVAALTDKAIAVVVGEND